MADLAGFEARNSGKRINSSRGILGQCVSVSARWQEDNGAVGVFGSTAAWIFRNNRGAWDVIPNTPTGVPVPGDIFFFDEVYGGGAGHTGVVHSANLNTVTLFQQNDPAGSACSLKTYSYNHALGWFHPHFLNVAKPQGEDMINADQVKDLYRILLGREASQGEANNWANIPWTKAFYEIKDSPEGRAHAAAEAAAIAAVGTLTQKVNELSQNPTKADLQAVTDQLKAETDKVAELQAKVDSGVSDDQAATVVADKVGPLAKFIALVVKLVKGGK